MDLFTGRKIADLRKFNSLSQEALAEKLGVSRQAISKWERGEASPDMENVVALARLFNVSVDDLLGDKKAAEITDFDKLSSPQPPVAEPAAAVDTPTVSETAPPETAKDTAKKETAEEPVGAQPSGSGNTGEKTEEAPRAEAKKERGKTIAKKTAARIKKAKADKKELPRYRPELADKLRKIPVFALVPALYILFGLLFHAWHPGWLSILFIPMYYMFIWACNGSGRKSFLYRLPVPFAAIVLYVFTGLLFNTWHPGWIVFLFIPVYYAAVWKSE